jgi:hypothetical protein
MASRPRKPKRQPQELTQIRMSVDLKNRVRAYQEKLADKGVVTTFSAAARMLIEKGLKAG